MLNIKGIKRVLYISKNFSNNRYIKWQYKTINGEYKIK